MIRSRVTQLGEFINQAGNALAEEANAYRIEYGNPREVPERNMYDIAGEKLQQAGNWLIHLANQDSL